MMIDENQMETDENQMETDEKRRRETSTLGYMVNRTKTIISTRSRGRSQIEKKKKKCKVDDGNLLDECPQSSSSEAFVLQQRHSWVTVLAAICLAIFTLHTSVVVFVFQVIHPYIPTPNTDKLFDDFDFPSDEIIEDTIPFIQGWLLQNKLWQNEDSQRTSHDAVNQTLGRSNNTRVSCIDFYMNGIKESIPITSPSYVRLVLKNLGDHLYNSPLIQTALYDLLNEPQDLHSLYEVSQECLGDNRPFVELACTAQEYIEAPSLHDDNDTKIIFKYMVNFAAVLETLTNHLDKDFQTLNMISEAMATSRRKEIEHHAEVTYSHDRAYLEFFLAKYRSVLVAMQVVVTSKEVGSIPPSLNIDALLQLNILEAVKLDLLYKKEDNARVGLTLAANTRAGGYVEAHEFLNQLDKNWIDAYIAWNFAFVFTSASSAMDRIGKLLIPSISCSSNVYTRDRFFQRRLISLALSVMHLYDSINTDMISDISEKEASALRHFYDNIRKVSDNDKNTSLVANALGKSNVEAVILTDPDDDTVWKMLYNICGEKCHGPGLGVTDTGMTSSLLEDDEDFLVYIGFINWLTVIISGIGLEIFMILICMKSGWNAAFEDQWKFAQFLFSILALVALGLASAQNHLALLTLVIGCWKFGFPETVVPMFCALFDKSASKTKRICLAMDSIGTALHHSSASLLICMLLTGAIIPDRFIFDPILILCMQHWFVLLHDYYPTLYITIQVILELWFEWTVISNLEHYLANHWTTEVAACGMLLAHWIWFVAGILNIVMGSKVAMIGFTAQSDDSNSTKETKKDNNVHTGHAGSYDEDFSC